LNVPSYPYYLQNFDAWVKYATLFMLYSSKMDVEMEIWLGEWNILTSMNITKVDKKA
jgi:hypothetical protein